MSSNTQSRTAPAQQSPSFAAKLYGAVTRTATSIGSWMASFVETEAVTPPSTYQPVAAYLSPAPPFIDAPTNLTVTAASSTSINLSWTAPGGSVDHYIVERGENVQGPFGFVANVTGATTKNDATVTNLHAYLYRVRAVSTTGALSAPSNMALGTAITFQFSSLAGQEIRAQHFHDVRTAINAVRLIGNLSGVSWTRGTLTNLEVQASDVNEMRTGLDAGLTALSIPLTAYTDPTLSVGANGTLIKAIHIEELQTRSTRGSSTSSGPIDSDSSTARLDPLNETGGGGENPLSRNFNWNLPLVSLPGRAGLDLGLTLSYNSLVWTKIGANAISFNDDNGFPGPGFRLGFPVIQHRYFNSEAGTQAYLVISPDGSRTELRQVGTSNFYEAADSSHLVLDESVNPMILRTTDGTQLSYVLHGDEFQCTQIKDRNGNFITVSYNAAARINTITDTLNRVITFNYVNGWLTSITQSWKQHLQTPVTHYWARFEYTHTTPIDFNFGSMNVFGVADNSQITTLSKVTLADDSRFEFSYTSWGQVWKVTRFAADSSVLNYRTYDLPQTATLAHSDCPRFTVRKDWAKYWNGDTDGTTAANEEVATATFIVPVSDSWTMPDNTLASGVRTEVTTPDGTVHKIYFVGTAGSDLGWKRGLRSLVETYSGVQWKRKVMTTWTQDDETSPFVLNPRVKETNVYDPDNRARTEVDYGAAFDLGNGMSCHLPRVVFEYAANASTKLRSTRITYNMTAPYKDRRILGLVSVRELFDGDVTGSLKSKGNYFYDDENGSTSIQGTDAPVQHDNTNYTASFVTGRANLSSVQRFNVDNLAESTTTRNKYNTAGAVVFAKDASDHQTTISYADSFSDGTPRNTLAYPTKITDPDTFETTAKFDFDFGAVTSQRTPKPNETTNVLEALRPEQVLTYDSIGRLEQITNSVNSALTRFEYPNTNRVETFATIEAGQGEARSFQITDGAGRVVASAKDHPTGTPGNFSGQKVIYDVMGRVFKQSNPAETSASGHPSQWTTAGDDAAAGWIYSQQTYDWKGRPLVTTNQDSTTNTASYSGCGCAGGTVVTLTDEGTVEGGVAKRRQQKTYSDVLGRLVKTETLNWENGSVYATTVNTYNVRDQVTLVRQYAGGEGSGTFQDTTMSYDGYGRLKNEHLPQQDEGEFTSYSYYADDRLESITDARGGTTTYQHNGRHLITEISYSAPSGIIIPSTAGLAYDAASNRLWLTDGVGRVDYEYDQLSQLEEEIRTFNDSLPQAPLSNNRYRLSYTYNLAGELSSLTDPFGAIINYGRNKAGQLTSVTGSPFGGTTTYASNAQYRASGMLKHLEFGNGQQKNTSYDVRLNPTSFSISGPGQQVMQRQYQYYADGRLRYVQDQLDPKFDRLNEYDHVGRIVEARSGAEARGQTESNHENLPYHFSYTHDAFGHMTSRTGTQWIIDNNSMQTFTNDRQDFVGVDADGRILAGGTGATLIDPWVFTDLYQYDAAGRVGAIEQWGDPPPDEINPDPPEWRMQKLNSGRDGDGLEVKQAILNFSETGQQTSSFNKYFIRSTVLDGDVVTEAWGDGRKTRTLVYAGGTVLGWQVMKAPQGSGSDIPEVWWNYEDPGDTAVEMRNKNGAWDSWASSYSGISMTKAELDPMGGDIGWSYGVVLPVPEPPSSGNFGGGFGWPDFEGDPELPDGTRLTCVLDGHRTPCANAWSVLRLGIGVDMLKIDGPFSTYLSPGFNVTENKRWVTAGTETAHVKSRVRELGDDWSKGDKRERPRPGHFETVGFEVSGMEILATEPQDPPDNTGGGGPTSQERPGRKPRRLSPNSNECRALAAKIENILGRIHRAAQNILSDNLNLPLTGPGPRRGTIEGHRQILDEEIKNLERRRQEYNDKCGGGPGAPGVPVPLTPPVVTPAPGSNPGPRLSPVPTWIPRFMLIPLIITDPCLVYPHLCFKPNA